MGNHLVDSTEKAENAESSENVTDKRNQKYITPNNRLTIFVQQCAANTRLYESCGCYSGGRVSSTGLQKMHRSELRNLANFVESLNIRDFCS